MLLKLVAIGYLRVANQIVNAPVGEQLVNDFAVAHLRIILRRIGVTETAIGNIILIDIQRVKLHGHHGLDAQWSPLNVSCTLVAILARHLLDFVDGELVFAHADDALLQVRNFLFSGLGALDDRCCRTLEEIARETLDDGKVHAVLFALPAHRLLVGTRGCDAQHHIVALRHLVLDFLPADGVDQLFRRQLIDRRGLDDLLRIILIRAEQFHIVFILQFLALLAFTANETRLSPLHGNVLDGVELARIATDERGRQQSRILQNVKRVEIAGALAAQFQGCGVVVLFLILGLFLAVVVLFFLLGDRRDFRLLLLPLRLLYFFLLRHRRLYHEQLEGTLALVLNIHIVEQQTIGVGRHGLDLCGIGGLFPELRLDDVLRNDDHRREQAFHLIDHGVVVNGIVGLLHGVHLHHLEIIGEACGCGVTSHDRLPPGELRIHLLHLGNGHEIERVVGHRCQELRGLCLVAHREVTIAGRRAAHGHGLRERGVPPVGRQLCAILSFRQQTERAVKIIVEQSRRGLHLVLRQMVEHGAHLDERQLIGAAGRHGEGPQGQSLGRRDDLQSAAGHGLPQVDAEIDVLLNTSIIGQGDVEILPGVVDIHGHLWGQHLLYGRYGDRYVLCGYCSHQQRATYDKQSHHCLASACGTAQDVCCHICSHIL